MSGVVLVALGVMGCNDPVVCPAYKAFDGVFLDYRQAGLSGEVTGQICLDAQCADVASWRSVADRGAGELALRLGGGAEDVRLRLVLTGEDDRRLEADEVVPLLAVYSDDRRCGAYGRSRVVDVLPGGSLRLGPAVRG